MFKYVSGIGFLLVCGVVAMARLEPPPEPQSLRQNPNQAKVYGLEPLEVPPEYYGSSAGLGGFTLFPNGEKIPNGNRLEFVAKRLHRLRWPSFIRTFVEVREMGEGGANCCDGQEDGDLVFEFRGHERIVDSHEFVNEVLPLPVVIHKPGKYVIWTGTEVLGENDDQWERSASVSHRITILQ